MPFFWHCRCMLAQQGFLWVNGCFMKNAICVKLINVVHACLSTLGLFRVKKTNINLITLKITTHFDGYKISEILFV